MTVWGGRLSSNRHLHSHSINRPFHTPHSNKLLSLKLTEGFMFTIYLFTNLIAKLN